MRKGVKAVAVGGVCAVLVGGAVYGGYSFVSALSGDTVAAGQSVQVKTGPPDAGEVKDASAEFFAAWQKGDATTAASYTNFPDAARELLFSYGHDARIAGVRVTPGEATGATVPFSVKATVSYGGTSRTLAYRSRLTVVRGTNSHRALVDWAPSVVYPGLEKGDRLVTGESAAPPIRAVDRHGAVLTADAYPSLGPILDELREKYGEQAGGTPSVELRARHPETDAPDTPLVTLAKGRPGTLRTTLSASAQAAAEQAVQRFGESSLVAEQASTGEVLAVANHRDDAFNAAFLGRLAPGSTMKIVTAAALIDNGLATASGPAPCYSDLMWEGETFHNLTGMRPDQGATLADSFSRSCNTAFIKFTPKMRDETLTREAQDRFGLGRDDWKTGIPSFDGSVPAVTGPDKAADLIGQGQVQMSPLNMASVTATAMTGRFRQPVLVSQRLDHRETARARGLPAGTVAQLRQMMNRAATTGTAAAAMSGLSGSVGAKTGSAEVDGQAKSNSWFTGYRDDVAAAAMTQEGGHGGDAAGPIVAAVLRAAD
ncbi:penicillin-binding transpeptidase domain-containing protein [Streptomyces sp. NPDC046985]|uniref:penicillin-binding transpeptidase domain-containing protein n=1 Tax=Streptomyces sp. NPDC046985 TaxID=3155377 RepID=UPI0033F5A2B3